MKWKTTHEANGKQENSIIPVAGAVLVIMHLETRGPGTRDQEAHARVD